MQVVAGHVDPVVGDTALREVVGAYLLRPVPGPDLGPAIPGDRLLLLTQLHVPQASAQHVHSVLPVLKLRPLFLGRDDEPCRDVRHAHGGGDLVHVLTSGAAGVVDIHADILGFDFDLQLIGLRQYRHGRRGGVDAALRLSGRNALDTVHATFVLQPVEGAPALDLEDHFLDATDAGFVDIDESNVPADGLGVPLIHPV